MWEKSSNNLEVFEIYLKSTKYPIEYYNFFSIILIIFLVRLFKNYLIN